MAAKKLEQQSLEKNNEEEKEDKDSVKEKIKSYEEEIKELKMRLAN